MESRVRKLKMRGTKAKRIRRFAGAKNRKLVEKGLKKAVHARMIKRMYNRSAMEAKKACNLILNPPIFVFIISSKRGKN